MFDFGRLVVGGEFDGDLSQIGIEVNEDADLPGTPVTTEIGEIDSIARAKLRLGYDAGRVLPYLTAGLARASVSFNEEIAGPDDPAIEESYSGRFVGVGASFMASERLMVSIEAIRHNFDDLPSNEAEEDNEGFQYDTIVNTVTLRGSIRF
jgi:opacity protein-like surface antigen